MNKSIQSMLAILALVGGASLSGLVEAANRHGDWVVPVYPDDDQDDMNLPFGMNVNDFEPDAVVPFSTGAPVQVHDDSYAAEWAPDDWNDATVPMSSFDDAKNQCLDSVRDDLRSVNLPSDIEGMLDQLRSENPGESMKDLIESGLHNQAMPNSCPEFVARIESIKERHCGHLFRQNYSFYANIDDDLIEDNNISEVIFGVQACVKVVNYG